MRSGSALAIAPQVGVRLRPGVPAGGPAAARGPEPARGSAGRSLAPPPFRIAPQGLPIWSAGGSRDRARGRGISGDLGPCRPGPTPAEPPRGSATVKIAQGKGTLEGNRRGTGTGQRPKGPNRRTPDEGKPEEGGGRGRTRRANGKPEESPPREPEDVR